MKVREVYVKAYVKGIDKGVKNTVPVKVREVYVKTYVKYFFFAITILWDFGPYLAAPSKPHYWSGPPSIGIFIQSIDFYQGRGLQG